LRERLWPRARRGAAKASKSAVLQMARAVTDLVLSDKILESAIEAALALASIGCDVS